MEWAIPVPKGRHVELVLRPGGSRASQSDQCQNPDELSQRAKEIHAVRRGLGTESGLSRSSFGQQMFKELLLCAKYWECSN
jgi:hypothetical protein